MTELLLSREKRYSIPINYNQSFSPSLFRVSVFMPSTQSSSTPKSSKKKRISLLELQFNQSNFEDFINMLPFATKDNRLLNLVLATYANYIVYYEGNVIVKKSTDDDINIIFNFIRLILKFGDKLVELTRNGKKVSYTVYTA